MTVPDGTIGWHHWINDAVLDGQGRLIEFQGVGRDITDRKRAEEAVDSSRRATSQSSARYPI